MPILDETPNVLGQDYDPVVPEAVPAPSWLDTITASARQENDIVNAVELWGRPRFEPDFSMDFDAEVKKRNLWDRRSDLLDARSPAELDYMAQQIQQEDRDRDTLARSGWAGWAAMVGSGAVSPTSFIPFLKGATGLKAVLKGAAAIGSGAAAQEAVLFANQRTRTPEEAEFSIAASTILGGILGGASHFLSKREFDKAAFDMANSPKPEAISEPGARSAGAEAVTDVGATVGTTAAGKLASGLGNRLARLSPVTKLIQQYHAPDFIKEAGGSALIRSGVTQFSQAGLRLEGNTLGEVAAAGGNIEGLSTTFLANAYRGNEELKQAYEAYISGSAGKIFGTVRAQIAGFFDKSKMDWSDFKTEVTRQLWTQSQNADKHVRQAAEAIDKRVFKPIYDEAVKAKIFSGEEKIIGDKGYASRIWNDLAIGKNENKLIEILSAHFQQNHLLPQFREDLARTREKIAKDQDFVDATKLSAAEVDVRRTQLENAKENIGENYSSEVNAARLASQELRQTNIELARQNREAKNARAHGGAQDLERTQQIVAREKQIKANKAKIEAITTPHADALRAMKKEHALINSRLRNLNEAHSIQDAKLAKAEEKLDALDEAQLHTLERTERQAKKFLESLDRLSDKDFAKEFSKLEKQAEDAAVKYYKTTERMKNTQAAPPELIAKREVLFEKLEAKRAEWRALKGEDREALRAVARDMLDTFNEGKAGVLEGRVLRKQRIAAQAEKFTPEARATRLAERQAKLKGHMPEFIGRWNSKADIDMEKGTANFKEHADDLARELVTRLRGNLNRLPYSDIFQSARGPELARMLDIDSTLVQDFLETDIEKIVNIYARTLGGDIAIAKKFGDTNMAEFFQKLERERQTVKARVEGMVDKKGIALDQKAKEKLQRQIDDFYGDAKHNFEVLLERAKGVRGLPADPKALLPRAGKSLRQLNTMRYMGGTVMASLADPSRVVMKYGLMRAMKSSFLPLISNFKSLKMAAREARLSGVGIDGASHSRFMSMNDVFDDTNPGTVIERGLNTAHNKFGAVTGMDWWNNNLKAMGAASAIARFGEALHIVVGGAKASAKDVKKATEFLARHNIDRKNAEVMWGQYMREGGSDKIGDSWMPNTEAWDVSDPAVAQAQQTFRAGLANAVNDTIITPGFELPGWTDANLLNKMLSQFKTFMFSSTQKTLMAGLQERDAAFVTGITMAMGLGAASYYLSAVVAGGETYDKMMKAPLSKWADEAISRSGVTAIFDEAQRVAQRVPLLREYSSFSGQRSGRREGADLLEEVLGPSFDALEKMSGVISELDAPTQHTLHLVRQLLPYQNLFYFRQLLTKIEESAGSNLPKRRQQ